MSDQGTEIAVSGGQTFIQFSASEKGALVSVRHGEGGDNLVSGTRDLWIAELAGGELRSGKADRFGWERTGTSVDMRWVFDTPSLRVQVTLSPQGDTGAIAASWAARCDSAGGLCVKEVHFPRFRAGDALEKIIRPACSYWPEIPVEQYMKTDVDKAEMAAGLIHDAVCGTDEYYGGLYPGAWGAVPFFASWGKECQGLYIGAHDADAFTKTLVWDHREVSFTFHVPDPDMARSEATIPYPVVIATFRGDWQDGADFYRDWARKSAPWCHRGALAESAPDWARQSVAWFYSMSDFPLPWEELLPRLRELFGIEGPIGVHALAPNVQDHSNMPLGEPDEWLRDYKRRQHRIAREHGYFVFEYRNAHKYTKEFPGYESARPHAFRWHGRLHEEGPYKGGPGFRSGYVPAGTPGSERKGVGEDAYGLMIEQEEYPLVEMCIGTDYWQKKLLDAVAPGASYGLIGNYLDQIGHNRNMSRCDAVGHGHPVRGGNWYVRGHEEVLRQIIRHYRLMGVERPILSHESFCEPLLGMLNTALLDGDLRLLSYLYHPYVFLESHEPYSGMKDLEMLRLALARDFHTGRIPTLDIPCSLPGVDIIAVLRDKRAGTDHEAIRVIRQWLKVRAAWLTYLNLGTMLHGPVPAEGSGEVITSAWESPSGEVALFASNATGSTQKVILDLDADPKTTWRAWLNDWQNALEADGRFEWNLGPDETVIIETCGGRA